jgi:UDP-N-acetylglucosamine--N-acetylmuramyl-(pentapeptide) pyrophosphoryl-undecaprenol N-acetylglucosamine transferase
MTETKARHGGYLIAGGGTGGHVFPALALAGELRRRRPEAPIVFVGTARGIETDLVPRAGYPLELIRARGLVGKSAGDTARGALSLPLGFVDSWRVVTRHRPRAVVGVGGYAAGPVVATAWARRIPTVLHESNAVPGLTNRLLAILAGRIAVGGEEARRVLPGAVVTGNPVRPEFFSIPSLDARPVPRSLRILVVGGSQGAAILNRLVPLALGELAGEGLSFDVVHQCGRRALESADGPGGVGTLYREAGIPAAAVRGFLHDLPTELAAADLVVCRSGAMTVAEVAAAGRPALFVPFRLAAHGHQEANARALERAGAAAVVTEEGAEAGELGPALRVLLVDLARLSVMGRAARAQARPDAAARVCDLVLSAETEANR